MNKKTLFSIRYLRTLIRIPAQQKRQEEREKEKKYPQDLGSCGYF